VTDIVGRTHQAHFVAAGARVDPELLLEDAQSVVSVSVENGRRVVVVEDEGLAGGGFVSGQGGPFARAST
jgi:hypothetical protein